MYSDLVTTVYQNNLTKQLYFNILHVDSQTHLKPCIFINIQNYFMFSCLLFLLTIQGGKAKRKI